jgi:hypothetical protein
MKLRHILKRRSAITCERTWHSTALGFRPATVFGSGRPSRREYATRDTAKDFSGGRDIGRRAGGRWKIVTRWMAPMPEDRKLVQQKYVNSAQKYAKVHGITPRQCSD